MLYEIDTVADANFSGGNDRAVQSDLSVELADDLAQHAEVLHSRVGVVGCHDTAVAQTVNLDDDLACTQLLPFPTALRKTFAHFLRMSSNAASARGSFFCDNQNAAFLRTARLEWFFIRSISIGTDWSLGRL